MPARRERDSPEVHLLGRANWWLPARLDRVVPQLHIEGRPERHLPARGPRPDHMDPQAAVWERKGVVRWRFTLAGLILAGLHALLLLVGVIAGPLSMWMLERRTLATTPKAYHVFVEGCAWQTSLAILMPWGSVGLVIGGFLICMRTRAVGTTLTALAVGWQASAVWLIFELGVGWCGDPDGESLVRDATPAWLGQAWLAWLALGIALGAGHVVALIGSRVPATPGVP